MPFFNTFEQLLLSFFVPQHLSLAEIKPMKVVANLELKCYEIPEFKECIVTDGIDLNNINTLSKKNKFINMSNSKILSNSAFMVKHVTIMESNIFANEFFQLLSPNTKFLTCTDTVITPKIGFKNILKQIPNITNVTFFETNILMGNEWPADLLNFKNFDNLKLIKIQIDNTDFKISTLAAIFRVKKYSKNNSNKKITFLEKQKYLC